MLKTHTVHLVGYASGIAGAISGSEEAPGVIQRSLLMAEGQNKSTLFQWEKIMQSLLPATASKLERVVDVSQQLAKETRRLVQNKQFFTVIGGDHSSAIGTWSGAQAGLSGELGLVWIDAHMDSHTPETTCTGNIHGMPLACLLGYGKKELTHIETDFPKIKPQHLYLVGIRSFEKEEEMLLKKLNVRIYYMEEVKRRGLKAIFQEILEVLQKNTAHFGISLDIDGIDPTEAPGTGVPEPDGMQANELCEALRIFTKAPQYIGAEIVEFNPRLDREDRVTEKLVIRLLHMLAGEGVEGVSSANLMPGPR